MRKSSWIKWSCLLAGGALLLQAPTCAQYTATVGDLAMVAAAGGVWYLVSRVLE
ncbi:MAG: hypothetical protein PVJ57_07865 [Phycisphaerae bacterium]|jgi:hypothetical protein